CRNRCQAPGLVQPLCYRTPPAGVPSGQVAPIKSTIEAAVVTRNSFGLSDIGKRRLSNEDAFLIDDELGLYVVADGMGGHNAGEVASGEAVDALHGMVARERDALEAMDGVERRSWLPSVEEMPS